MFNIKEKEEESRIEEKTKKEEYTLEAIFGSSIDNSDSESDLEWACFPNETMSNEHRYF